MPILVALLAGLLVAAAIVAAGLAGRGSLRQLPRSNQDWVWY